MSSYRSCRHAWWLWRRARKKAAAAADKKGSGLLWKAAGGHADGQQGLTGAGGGAGVPQRPADERKRSASSSQHSALTMQADSSRRISDLQLELDQARRDMEAHRGELIKARNELDSAAGSWQQGSAPGAEQPTQGEGGADDSLQSAVARLRRVSRVTPRSAEYQASLDVSEES